MKFPTNHIMNAICWQVLLVIWISNSSIWSSSVHISLIGSYKLFQGTLNKAESWTKKAPQQNLIISHIDLRPPTTPTTVRSHSPQQRLLAYVVNYCGHNPSSYEEALTNLELDVCVRPFSVDKRSRSIQPRFREIKYRQEAKHGFHDWWRWRDTSLLLLIIPHRNGTF